MALYWKPACCCCGKTKAMYKVDAILMASGFSSRFPGQNKLLLPFGGKAVLAHTLELVCTPGLFNRVFLVYAHATVAELAQSYALTPLFNAGPEKGQRESIRLGVKASQADFYAFFTCDQPLLDKETVEKLLDRLEPGKIIFPQYQNAPGNPSIFAKTYRQSLLNIPPQGHARDIKRKNASRLIAVEIGNPKVLRDIDTPSEYEELLTML